MGVVTARAATARRPWLTAARFEAIAGYLFILPWLAGLFIFTVGPMIFSALLCFQENDLLTPMKWVGLGNFGTMIEDELFWKALRNTAIYSVGVVGLGMVASLALALLMNARARGITIYRTIYYLPAVLPAAPVALLWIQIFNPDSGLANTVLGWFGLPGLRWIYSEHLAMPCLVIMALWGIGGGLVIYLAGLQGIPQELYDAAQVDGAGWWPQLLHVTIPMLSPTIFFNLVMSIIGSFMVFTQSFVMTGGGPNNATLTYVLYLYRNAFGYFKFGYASALAWVLFLITLSLSLVVFRSAPYWVYYEGEAR